VSRKIEIDESVLESLYLDEKKSSYEIAKIFNCDSTVIQRRLKEHEIELRQPKKRIDIPKEVLEKLYWGENLSTYKIAKKLGIGRTTIWSKLDGLNIKRRKLKRVPISKETLNNLYWGRRLCAREIGEIYNLSNSVILDKLYKNGIRTRDSGEAGEIYPKTDFSGNLEEKAHMIGFRLGDLYCVRASPRLVRVSSNTTKKAQLELMKSVYGEYGRPWIKEYSGVYGFGCLLNNTFSFLLAKEDKIEDWILKDNNYFCAFFAGYVDAEGTIKIYNKRARFRVGSYDKGLLKDASRKLTEFGIRHTYRIDSFKGKNQNSDFWRIGICEKQSLLKVFNLIEPYMKHGDRLKDLEKAKANVIQRLQK